MLISISFVLKLPNLNKKGTKKILIKLRKTIFCFSKSNSGFIHYIWKVLCVLFVCRDFQSMCSLSKAIFFWTLNSAVIVDEKYFGHTNALISRLKQYARFLSIFYYVYSVYIKVCRMSVLITYMLYIVWDFRQILFCKCSHKFTVTVSKYLILVQP